MRSLQYTPPAYKPIDFSAMLASMTQNQTQPKQPAQKNPLSSATKDAASNKLLDMFGGAEPVTSEAANAAYNAPAMEAANSAWNADAMAAYGGQQAAGIDAAAPTIAGNAAEMGAGPIAAIIAATYLGGKSAYDMATGKSKAWQKSSLPDKAGRATLAIASGGLSEVGNKLFGGRKSTKEIQTGRWKDLAKQGITGAESFYKQLGTEPASGPRYSKFQETGNKADLSAEDVWGSPDVIRAAGNDYFGSWDEGKRRAFSQALLDKGLLDNRKGGIYATNDQAAADLAKQFNSTPTVAAKPQIDAGTLKRWRESRTMIPRTGR